MPKNNINIFIILFGILSINLSLADMIKKNRTSIHYPLTNQNYLETISTQENINAFEKDNDGVVMFLVQFTISNNEDMQKNILTDNKCYQGLWDIRGISESPGFKGSIDIYFDDRKVETINTEDYTLAARHKRNHFKDKDRNVLQITPGVLGRSTLKKTDGYIFLIYKDDIHKVSIIPHLTIRNQDNSQNSTYICAQMLTTRNAKIPLIFYELLSPNSPWINLYKYSETYPLKGDIPTFIKNINERALWRQRTRLY